MTPDRDQGLARPLNPRGHKIVGTGFGNPAAEFVNGTTTYPITSRRLGYLRTELSLNHHRKLKA